MSPVAIELATALNNLATQYNNGVGNINFIELTAIEKLISDLGFDLEEVNEYLNF